jgi:hypothetical protein
MIYLSSQWQSVLPSLFASSTVIFTVRYVQLLKPRQCSFKWYLLAFGLAQTYTIVESLQPTPIKKRKSKANFIAVTIIIFPRFRFR